jgi:hypothetical protein
MAAEQKRVEGEFLDQRNGGMTSRASQLDRTAESNRRILESAVTSLNAGQLEMVRDWFEQRVAMDRASSVDLPRER